MWETHNHSNMSRVVSLGCMGYNFPGSLSFTCWFTGISPSRIILDASCHGNSLELRLCQDTSETGCCQGTCEGRRRKKHVFLSSVTKDHSWRPGVSRSMAGVLAFCLLGEISLPSLV